MSGEAARAEPCRSYDLADRIPTGAVIITPSDDQPLECGHGYIAETSTEVMYLTIRDATRGPHTILFTPQLASDVADLMTARCAKLEQLHAARARADRNGSNDD